MAAILLPLSACDTVYGFAEDVGSHLPTVGERCEHWQCVTGGGREQSEMKKRMRTMEGEQPPPAGAAPGAPGAASGRKPVPQNPARPAPGVQPPAAPAAPKSAAHNPYDYYRPGEEFPPPEPEQPKPLLGWPQGSGQE